MIVKTAEIKIKYSGDRQIFHRLNEDIFLIVQEDIARLLDFARGQFYGLDSIGTLMLCLYLECGETETVTQIAQKYNINPDIVRTDLTGMLQNLEGNHLLISTEKNTAARVDLLAKIKQFLGNTSFLFLKAASWLLQSMFNRPQRKNSQLNTALSRFTVQLLLTLSWLSFRLLGWGRTISLWRRWDKPTDTPKESVKELIEAVDRLVREAAAWNVFLPMVCKERALVGYHILRAFYGLPTTFIVGIDCNPFQMHAWVECDGLVVTDDPAHCKLFNPIIRYV